MALSKTDWFDRVFSACLLLGIVMVAAALLGACASSMPRYKSPYQLPSEKQRAASVAIRMSCLSIEAGRVLSWRGSGTITGEHTILTANHVVECDSGIYELTAQTLDGETYEAKVVVQAEDHDIAKIVTSEALPWFVFVIGPRPEVGAIVCSESAIPLRARKCGKVTSVRPEPSDRDIGLEAFVVKGNSGSGVFDVHGRLIGIVTQCRANRFGCIGTGRAASLESHAEVMGTSY